MKFAISLSLAAAAASMLSAQSSMRETVLRQAAIDAGIVEPLSLVPAVPSDLAAIGERLFESELLSLNGDTSCSSCHLDQFGSADGLRVAIGVGGRGEGNERAASGGDVVPRNTLPLWGRGGVGFETFFWDGKVSRTPDGLFSQFGAQAPSDDPLVIAAHLPIVQLREMLAEDELTDMEYRTETVESATQIGEIVVDRIRGDRELGPALAEARGTSLDDLAFIDIAEALAGFVRTKFAMRPSAFSNFLFQDGLLTEEELHGGLIFFGKGRCSSCHSGPYLTDFDFHTLALPQAGSGVNGFGVDYGRYNATLDTSDLYRFRTPPLWQVTETGPYSHSGSVDRLDDMIRYHFDPLFEWNPDRLSTEERVEFTRRLVLWGRDPTQIPALAEDEVDALVAFLTTLRFDTTSDPE
jgi:cytochrome c peroxidase